MEQPRPHPPASETETFGYNFLDRLTAVSGAYAESYTYNQIGNVLTRNGVSYTYGDANHKHAVTAVGSTGYAYDNNGNMTTRDTQTIAWDVENRPATVTGGASFVYDGDGNRVKKTENGQTILYINKYYEKNLTSGEATTYYYQGDRLVGKEDWDNPAICSSGPPDREFSGVRRKRQSAVSHQLSGGSRPHEGDLGFMIQDL